MRRILIMTGSRGEWGYIKPIIRLIEKSEDLSYFLCVSNMHLLPEYGNSVRDIRSEGVTVHEEIYAALAGSTHASMVKTLGMVMLSVTDTLQRERPDIVLLAGDRGEQLVTAIAAAHFNIPVAHIQAGEISGNIDGLSRHALARFAHIHFASNEDAAERLIKAGEQKFRVHNVGAPQLDDFINGCYADRAKVGDHFRLTEDKPIAILIQHPVTEQAHLAGEQMEISIRALSRLGLQVIVIYPNNDAGSELVKRKIRESGSSGFHVFRHIPRELYAGLMRVADVIVGNSSSGIIEAPTFALPAVNVGRRQEGRFRGPNVIDVPHDENDIVNAVKKALDPVFRKKLQGRANPYGDGQASHRIVDILKKIPIDETLIYKRMTY